MNNEFVVSRWSLVVGLTTSGLLYLLFLPLILLFAGKLLVYVPKLRFSSKYSEQLRSPQKLKFSGPPLLPPSTCVLFGRFGGDSSGRLGAVVLLNVGGGCSDRPQRFAGNCSKGDCSEDDRAKKHNGQ